MDSLSNVQVSTTIKTETEFEDQKAEITIDEHVFKEEFPAVKTEPLEIADDPDTCLAIPVKNEPFESDQESDLNSMPGVEQPNHTDGDLLYCFKCDVSFVSPEAFNVHWSNHVFAVCGSYRCRFCGCTFPYNCELTRHLKLCQKQMTTRQEVIHDGDLFICPKCFKSFAIREVCFRHVNRHYRFGPGKQHLLEENGMPPKSGKKRAMIKCPDCPKMYFTRENMERHREIHREAKLGRFRCKICGKDTESNYDLTKHSLVVHGKFQMAPSGAVPVPGAAKVKRKRTVETGKLV